MPDPRTGPTDAPRIAVVTDSTASLPADLAAARDIRVVPLQVIVADQVFDEGAPEVSPAAVATALREFRPVSTSRPVPAVFAEVYRGLQEEGFDEIISIHLSGDMSGTVESAQLAARDADLPVRVIDTRQVGVATGYAALSAADVRDAGGSAAAVADAAQERASLCSSLFYVDTLEYLRRGGRVGAAAALIGGALAVKPLLTLTDGRVANLEKVRTSSRALARLGDLAVERAADERVDLWVAHLANPERAADLAQRLGERLAVNLEERAVSCTEIGAVLSAHVGPGMVAVCVAPRLG